MIKYTLYHYGCIQRACFEGYTVVQLFSNLWLVFYNTYLYNKYRRKNFCADLHFRDF